MPGIHEALTDAFEGVEEIAAPEVSVEAPAAESAPAEAPVSDRPRDEAGRFAPKQPQQAAQEQPQAAPETPQRPEPPKSWKPEKRAKWESLDPEIAEYINQREEESNRGVEPLKKVWNAIQPYMPLIQESGLSPEFVVNDFFRTAQALKTGDPQTKFNVWMNIGKAYGVPVQQLTNPGEQPQVDPQIAQVLNELNQVKGTVSTFQQQQQEAAMAQANNILAEFARTHPHFEAVREQMGMLWNMGVTDLEQAYQKALRLNDDLWTQQQAQQREQEEKSRREQADKAAKAARASAVSPRSATPGATVMNNGAKDRRSILAEQLSSFDGRL
jgi:hypothetical protein